MRLSLHATVTFLIIWALFHLLLVWMLPAAHIQWWHAAVLAFVAQLLCAIAFLHQNRNKFLR